MKLKVEDPPPSIPEDSIHRARVDTITPREGTRKNGEKFVTLTWIFKITEEGPFHDRAIRGETGSKLTRGYRMHSWAEAILDRTLEVGVDLETDDLVGLPCDISIRHEPDRNDPAKTWERVDEVMGVSSSGWGDQPPF